MVLRTQRASTPKLTSEKFVETSVTTGQQQYYSELHTVYNWTI